MVWGANPGSGDFLMDSGDMFQVGTFDVSTITGFNPGSLVSIGNVAVMNATVLSNHNILLNQRAVEASGAGCIAMGNAITNPASVGTLEGGVLYASSGHLFFLGQLGTVTQVASA